MTLKDALVANKGVGPGFNFLRHALALLIIVYHARQLAYWQHSALVLAAAGVTDPDSAAAAAANGPVHVTLANIIRPGSHALLGMFFGLSGFLIAGSALRTGGVAKFFINRALRILPALAAETLLSAFILGPLITSLPLRDYFANAEFGEYLQNMVGWIHYYLPGVSFYPKGPFADPLYKTVNGQLWTLPIELDCYALMLGLMATKLIKARKLAAAISLVAISAMLALFFHDPARFAVKSPNSFAFWYLIAIFWFGVLFYLYSDHVRLRLSYFIFCAAGYWITIFADLATPLSGLFLSYCTIYIGFTQFKWWDRLVKVDYSYGMFLYHMPIMQAILYFMLPHLQGPLIVRFCLLLALSVPCTIAFAALSWRLVERPALSLRAVLSRTRTPGMGMARA